MKDDIMYYKPAMIIRYPNDQTAAVLSFLDDDHLRLLPCSHGLRFQLVSPCFALCLDITMAKQRLSSIIGHFGSSSPAFLSKGPDDVVIGKFKTMFLDVKFCYLHVLRC
jgi:hypothetical protein